MKKICIALAVALILAVVPVAAQVRAGFLLEAATTTATGTNARPGSPMLSLHAYGETSSGSGSSTIVIEVSNLDSPVTTTNVDWLTACTITLTLATTRSGDSCVINAPWRTIRARVTAISGTGASVNVRIGG